LLWLLSAASFFAGASSVLYAQAKPPAYIIAEIDVKDQDGYGNDFLPKAQTLIKESGGKYLAGGANKAIGLAGAPLLIALFCCNSLRWMRSRRSLQNKISSRRMSGANTPVSVP